MDDNNGLISDIINWFAHPFRTDGSAFNWLMFVGLLMIIAWFWNIVLLSIHE